MASTLLDASALLALIFDEEGADAVKTAAVAGAAMSAANVAEVAARLHMDDWSPEDVACVCNNLNIEIIPVDSEIALLSGAYRPKTLKFGLGLGDRLCLATAKVKNTPVLTSDQIWKKIRLSGVKIKSIR